jgi:hypothetical protein
MPVSCLVLTLFVVLGSSAMGLGGKLVVLGSLPVQIVHNTSVQRKGVIDATSSQRSLELHLIDAAGTGGIVSVEAPALRRDDSGSLQIVPLILNSEVGQLTPWLFSRLRVGNPTSAKLDSHNVNGSKQIG